MYAITGKNREVREETEQERRTRQAGNFQRTESNLAVIDRRIGIRILDRIFSYLGQQNPFAYDVNPTTESVWLLDTIAYRPISLLTRKPGSWQAEARAAYFKRGTGNDVRAIVDSVVYLTGLGRAKDAEYGSDDEDDEANERHVAKTIAERLQPFVNSIAPARSVRVKLPTGQIRRLGPGGPSAGSEQIISRLGEHDDGDIAFLPAVPRKVAPYGPMKMYFAGPEGWAVVSDIDDTIKTTMTPSSTGILCSTFISDPTPIPSMPALYAHIATTLSPTWFYLSASPYNLYPFLSNFISTYYPPGPIFLRNASWMDLPGMLRTLTTGTQAYKLGQLELLHTQFPLRKLILIGDSTQTDPEAYGDICRKYKGWVKAVWIRMVVDVAEMVGTGKNEESRFEEAFRGVDRAVWTVFERPEELWTCVEDLKRRG